MITDHPYKYPQFILDKLEGKLSPGIYPPMANCGVCNRSPDYHLNIPDSERKYRSWPPLETGMATFPIPI